MAVRKTLASQPFRPCKAPPPPAILLGLRVPDKFRVPETPGRKLEAMALSEAQQRNIYIKVAGTLMVLLLLYGALMLAGVVR
jgi:hypothetical protein